MLYSDFKERSESCDSKNFAEKVFLSLPAKLFFITSADPLSRPVFHFSRVTGRTFLSSLTFRFRVGRAVKDSMIIPFSNGLSTPQRHLFARHHKANKHSIIN